MGPYYYAIGADKAYGRDVVCAYYKACLYTGININGINGEVMPGQWKFQVAPSAGISSRNQVWVARYILERVIEAASVVVSFDPKPIQDNFSLCLKRQILVCVSFSFEYMHIIGSFIKFPKSQ
ncbi:hypothetical protein SUGI_0544940 [Cryptomeria japonica]|nr:hypothetical protein SUGI_0544940 [Cryptomeria japonica]